jgi:hypothetical protein
VSKIIKIFLILTASAFMCYSQTDSTNHISISDPLKINLNQNPINKMQIMIADFDLYRELNSLKQNITINGDPQTVWLRTSMVISNTENPDHKFEPNLLLPLERKYNQDSKFDAIKYVLGMAQVGAVGYLAYKHIKKYGFLK